MSSTNKTVNKELSQFIGSDKPSFLTDYNSDMNKIDLALKANTDLANVADGKGTSALSGLSAIENALPTKANAESPIITGTMNLQGGKIQFPSSPLPSSNVNVLDDYEEGTFTPYIIGMTSSGLGNYSLQLGEYTKIGDTVFYSLELICQSHTGTGELRVKGLPFDFNATMNARIQQIYSNGLIMSSNKFPLALGQPSSNEIKIRQSDLGSTTSDPIPVQSTYFVMAISGHYKV